jgi:putative oxidoreductase
LFLYLIPVTLVMHNFWAAPAAEQQNQIINFLKNVAILGGLLKFCAAGAGAYSLDAMLSRTGRTRPTAWSGLQRPV